MERQANPPRRNVALRLFTRERNAVVVGVRRIYELLRQRRALPRGVEHSPAVPRKRRRRDVPGRRKRGSRIHLACELLGFDLGGLRHAGRVWNFILHAGSKSRRASGSVDHSRFGWSFEAGRRDARALPGFLSEGQRLHDRGHDRHHQPADETRLS